MFRMLLRLSTLFCNGSARLRSSGYLVGAEVSSSSSFALSLVFILLSERCMHTHAQTVTQHAARWVPRPTTATKLFKQICKFLFFCADNFLKQSFYIQYYISCCQLSGACCADIKVQLIRIQKRICLIFISIFGFNQFQ